MGLRAFVWSKGEIGEARDIGQHFIKQETRRSGSGHAVSPMKRSGGGQFSNRDERGRGVALIQELVFCDRKFALGKGLGPLLHPVRLLWSALVSRVEDQGNDSAAGQQLRCCFECCKRRVRFCCDRFVSGGKVTEIEHHRRDRSACICAHSGMADGVESYLSQAGGFFRYRLYGLLLNIESDYLSGAPDAGGEKERIVAVTDRCIDGGVSLFQSFPDKLMSEPGGFGEGETLRGVTHRVRLNFRGDPPRAGAVSGLRGGR